MWLSFTVVSLGIVLFEIARVFLHFVIGTRNPSYAVFAIAVVTSLLLARVCYLRAIRSASDWWGETYRSAYDLYLGALEKQLGYDLPNDLASRRKFWCAMSIRFRYFSQQDVPALSLGTGGGAPSITAVSPGGAATGTAASVQQEALVEKGADDGNSIEHANRDTG